MGTKYGLPSHPESEVTNQFDTVISSTSFYLTSNATTGFETVVSTTSYYQESDTTNEFETVVSTTSFYPRSNVTNEVETEDDLPYVLPAFIGFILLMACVGTLLCFRIGRDMKNSKKAQISTKPKAKEQKMKVDMVQQENGDHLDDNVYLEIPDVYELVKDGLVPDASQTNQGQTEICGMDVNEYLTISESVNQPAILDATYDSDCEQNLADDFTRSDSESDEYLQPIATVMMHNEYISMQTKEATNADGSDTLYEVIPQTGQINEYIELTEM